MGTSIALRIDGEMLDRWKVAAAQRGVPLSTLIRRAVEREIGVETIGPGPVSVTVETTTDPTRPLMSHSTEASRAAAAGMRPRSMAITPCAKAARHRPGVRCGYCGETW